MFKILNKSLSLTKKLRTNVRSLSTAASNDIEFTTVNKIGVITLNRPKNLNALTCDMEASMALKIKEFSSNKNVQAILIKGSGNKAFCAGGDLRALYENGKSDTIFEFFKTEYQLVYQIANLGKPYISLLNGITMGAGAGISMHGKYRIATERTVFAMPETAIGFIADCGFYKFFQKLHDNISLFMGLTGHRVMGKDVRRLGIATHFVGESDLEGLENDLYACDKVEEDLESILAKYDQFCEGKYPTEQIHRHFSGLSLEGIFKGLESDGSDWSRKQLAKLNGMSPSSLHLTMRQFELQKSLSLGESIKLEYLMALRIYENEDNDFYEGVRSVIIDKGDRPKWKPDSIYDCDPRRIDMCFKKFDGDDELEFD